LINGVGGYSSPERTVPELIVCFVLYPVTINSTGYTPKVCFIWVLIGVLPFGLILSFLVSSTFEVLSCLKILSFVTGFSIAFGSSLVLEGTYRLKSLCLKASEDFKKAKSAVDPVNMTGFVFFAVMFPRVLLGLMLSRTYSNFCGALNIFIRLSVFTYSCDGASGFVLILRVALMSGLLIQFSWSVCSCSV